MKPYYLIIIIALLFIGCKDDVNDSSKRNEHNCWWLDPKTGEGKWVINNADDIALRNCRYILFYWNGQIREKGKRVDGKPTDTTFCYDRFGKLFAYIFHHNKIEQLYYLSDGPIKTYFPDGNLQNEGIIQNHVEGDRWKCYYENHRTQSVRNYTNGVGWATHYYENGNVEDSSYDDGKAFLSVKRWYENGRIKAYNEISDGDFNGLREEYYENGQLKTVGICVDGKIEGDLKYYDKRGVLLKTETYDHGLRIRTNVLAFPTGAVNKNL